MSIVYTVYKTSKAARSFQDLNHFLLAANHTPAERASQAIKIITIYLHNAHGNWLYPDQQSHRYIRVVVDIPRGRLQSEVHKQEFMLRTIEACYKYEGNKAVDCEVEVRINEFDECDYMKVGGAKGGADDINKLRKRPRESSNSQPRATHDGEEWGSAPEVEY